MAFVMSKTGVNRIAEFAVVVALSSMACRIREHGVVGDVGVVVGSMG